MKRRTFLKAGLAAVSVAASFATLPAFALSNAPMQKSYRRIQGSKMAYVDRGQGRPVVFLHGNPTSSYLWRNIIPYVTDTHRAIAPDLIGMGDSEKLDIEYSYQDHADHLFGLLDSFDLRDAVLVIHDWGSGLGWHYARTRPDRISAIAFMEAMVPPVHPIASLTGIGPSADFLNALRTPGVGEGLVLEQNVFVESFLREIGVVKPLSDEVMAEYRRPFQAPESRLPTLQWPRQIPIGGEPAEVYEVVAANSRFVLESELPKLGLYATPGAIINQQVIDFLNANARNLETVHVGEGRHFIQEEQPDAIGRALADWLARV